MNRRPNYKGVAISIATADENFEKRIAKLSAKHDHVFNKEVYDYGTYVGQSKMPLDEVEEQYQNDKNFLAGYQRGLRLAKIAEDESQGRGRH